MARSRKRRTRSDSPKADPREAASRLAGAIEATGLAQVLQSEHSRKQVNLKCRVLNENAWIPIVAFLLQEEERQDEEGWGAHICKHYFLRGEKVVYAWSITIGASDVTKVIGDVCRAIGVMSQSIRSLVNQPPPRNAKRAARSMPRKVRRNDERVVKRVGDRVEVTEMPLVGVSANRNAPQGPILSRNSKGAHPIK